jgi:uncharacterized protein (DUF1330 family)
MTLVVTLTVLRSEIDSFRQFEETAARVMRAHGGRIERVIRIAEESVSNATNQTLREVHIVTFPGRDHLDAYRRDPAIAAVRRWRDESVVATEVLIGDDISPYGSS